MLQDRELWTTIRRALLVDNMSKRSAAEHFGLGYRLIDKISRNETPGTYDRTSPSVTKLTAFRLVTASKA